jgi:plasmid stabilization system protein ParE
VKLVIAGAAERDLRGIGDWIARDNPQRALSFVKELHAACATIPDMPEAWPLVRRYESYGVRRKVHGNYLIFYTASKDAVTIIHVLHGAQDYDDLLPGSA